MVAAVADVSALDGVKMEAVQPPNTEQRMRVALQSPPREIMSQEIGQLYKIHTYT